MTDEIKKVTPKEAGVEVGGTDKNKWKLVDRVACVDGSRSEIWQSPQGRSFVTGLAKDDLHGAEIVRSKSVDDARIALGALVAKHGGDSAVPA